MDTPGRGISTAYWIAELIRRVEELSETVAKLNAEVERLKKEEK